MQLTGPEPATSRPIAYPLAAEPRLPPASIDAVEAHSCVDDSTDNRFLSKTQLIDKLTAGHFDPKVFVNCVQDDPLIHSPFKY